MRFFRHASPPGRLGAACGEAGCLRHNRHVAWLLPCPSVTFHTADNVSLIRPTRAILYFAFQGANRPKLQMIPTAIDSTAHSWPTISNVTTHITKGHGLGYTNKATALTTVCSTASDSRINQYTSPCCHSVCLTTAVKRAIAAQIPNAVARFRKIIT